MIFNYLLTYLNQAKNKLRLNNDVMAGDHDDGNPVERVVSAARLIPKHQIAIILNTGHGCFLENFTATWASIVPFLKK
ncbi:pimeloyl-ACP methyl ester carboxylesterase [Arcicella rosea]|uniref:alpha/beta fold hydrolase n=1 Tax=Arcicella rosea TaxID=502909 RepID=UPI00345D8DDB